VELYAWDGATHASMLKYWNQGKYRFTKQNQPELNKEYFISSVGAFVRFRTDNNLNASGFELNWYTTNAVEETRLETANVQVFPNPTSGQLHLRSYELQENTEYQIYSVVGQLLQSEIVNLQSEIEIDVSHLANGMYFLKIGNKVVKFIKE